jgi:methionyl aminopeptidase
MAASGPSRLAGVRYDRGVIELRSRAEVEAMRPAGRFVASVLAELAGRTRVGVNVLALDRIAHAMIREHGATSSYLDYHPSFGAMPFGKVLCVSVNDAVLHGLPHDRRLRDGDLVSLDFAAAVDGWVADSSITIPVGTPRDEDLRQIETAEQALAAGIAAAQPGNRLGDISAAIGGVIRGAGYEVNTAFGGHGVGRVMHARPDVPNDGTAGRGLEIRPGLVIAIEPWFLAGRPKIVIDRDGWTIRSVDGSRGVHVEHTVAVTGDGPLVLTDRAAVAVGQPR